MTNLRKDIQERAKKAMLKENTEECIKTYEVSKLAKKILNRNKEIERHLMPDSSVDYVEPVAPGSRKAIRKRKDLTVSE